MRYLVRPPLALDRLTERTGGQLLCQFRRPWRDGSTALLLDPLELLERLAALVPPPRRPLLAYHGVLAPRARWRAAIVPTPSPADARAAAAPVSRRWSWARLLRRVFALDVLVCARCAGPRRIHATLRVLLNAALDDRIILANPADKLARTLYLVRTVAARQEEIKALSREQLGAFLAAAARVTPRVAPLFVLLARTGMRLGEALALQWEDLDFTAREIRVARALTPKSGHGRTVGMSRQLARVLHRLEVEPESGDPQAWMAGTPSVGLLLRGRNTPRCQQRGQGVQAGAQGRRAPASRHPARSPSHLRVTSPLRASQSGVRAAAAWPRLYQAHGRHLRPVASQREQGGDRRAGRRGDEQAGEGRRDQPGHDPVAGLAGEPATAQW